MTWTAGFALICMLACGGSGEKVERKPDLREVMTTILVDRAWWGDFMSEDVLYEAIVVEMKEIRAQENEYADSVGAGGAAMASLRDQLHRAPRGAPLVVSYIAAGPNGFDAFDAAVVGTEEATDCAVGPGRLTFSQAQSLDIASQPAIVLAADEREGKSDKQLAKLLADSAPDTTGQWNAVRELPTADGRICIVGTDSKTAPDDDMRRELRYFGRRINMQLKNDEDVPRQGSELWLLTRIARFYLGTTEVDLLRPVSFDQMLDQQDPAQKLAYDRTVSLVAHATVLPCIGVMQEKTGSLEPATQPTKETCERLFELLDE